MAHTERAFLDDPRTAAQTLACELKRYERTRGSETDQAWRALAHVESLRRLVVSIKRQGRQGRASAAELKMAALGEALIDAVVDHAFVAQVCRDLGDRDEADKHAAEVLRRGEAVLNGADVDALLMRAIDEQVGRQRAVGRTLAG